MFKSPCALRSAACATLIALATAAGVVRVPEAAAPATTGAGPTPVAVVAVHRTAPLAPRIARRPKPAAIVHFSPPRHARPLTATTAPSRLRSASPYRLPYAVGPPRS